MKSEDQMIAKSILDSIEQYEDICDSETLCEFHNKNTGISLIPNIEEFFDVITANFNSNEIFVIDANAPRFNRFTIVSKKLSDKLREMAKVKIEKIKDNRKISHMSESEKSQYFKDKFINKFITERKQNGRNKNK